jgi:hypothetical protein
VERSQLDAIRSAVCAVGYLKIPPEEFQRDQLKAGLEIVGTGFLIGCGLLMTCAHVLADLKEEMARRHRPIPIAQRFVQFGQPSGDGTWEGGLWSFTEVVVSEVFDLAVVRLDDIDRVPMPAQPVRMVPKDHRPYVGDEIGMCGYAHGSVLLRRRPDQLLERVGPITQRGWIAAVVPFESVMPRALWLDLVAAPASSGSPVFLTETGQVLGVLIKSQEGRTPTVSLAAVIFDQGDWVTMTDTRLITI